MASRKKTTEMNAGELLSKYTEYILEQEKKPASVFKFCKSIGIEEVEFYKYYSSIEKIEAAFFVALHEHTLELLYKNEEYHSYDEANKLLSYYFTFFEMATANRSYILLSLKNAHHPFEKLKQLKELRTHFLLYAEDLLKERRLIPDEQLKKVEGKLLQEAAWLQFIFTMKFWMNDSSPNFEKTDLMIEKSVKASFDVLDNFPMKSIIDLGKFLWKERPFQ